MIEITSTRSTMLKTIGYDEKEQKLTVEFANGGKYSYSDVPKEQFTNMINADSEGKYFLANIKNNYKFEKE